jgi:outer membrane protein
VRAGAARVAEETMRNGMTKTLFLALGLAVVATAAHAQETRIAVVDVDQAINATDQGKKAREELQSKQKSAEAQLKPLIDKGRALSNEIQEKRFVLSEDALRQKQLDLAEIQSDLRAKGAELEGQFKVDYERIVGPLRQKLYDIITEIGKEQGYALVLERSTPGMIYAKEALDITDQVVERFNKKG